MSLLLTSGPLAVRATRLNPITKIVALVLLSLPVLITGDWRVALIVIVGQLLTLPWLGLGPRVLVRYAWPFLLALVGIWLANFLASGSVATLLPITARLVSLALPGLVFVLTTEPVELADAIVQLWRVPARFAYGALAAFRLVPLLSADLVSLRRARRARGVASGGNPIRALALALSLLFALLVAAIRRGTRLAFAMDARGFGTQLAEAGGRTFARRSRLARVDAAVMTGALLLAVAATAGGLLIG